MTKRQAIHILIQVPYYFLIPPKARLNIIKYYIKSYHSAIESQSFASETI